MKNIFLILFTIFTTSAIGQEFQTDIDNALTEHENSKNTVDQYSALENMEQVVKKYPKEWLPQFWACYQSTQMAMLKDREDFPKQLDFNELLERSELYLKGAKKIAGPTISDDLNSDFHSLNSLIYTFKELYSKDDTEAAKFKDLKESELIKATVLAPNSPIIMTFAATDLGRKENANYAELVASVQLMKRANEIFSKKPTRAMTTYFNQEWIQYWLPYLEGRIENLKSN